MVTPDWPSSDSVTTSGVTVATGSYTTGSSTTVNDEDAAKSPDTNRTSCEPTPRESLMKVKDTSPDSVALAVSTSEPPTVSETSAWAGKSLPVMVTPDWTSSDSVTTSGETAA